MERIELIIVGFLTPENAEQNCVLKPGAKLYDPRKITTRNNMYLGNCCNFCSMLVIFLSIRRKASKEINENLHHHVWY